MKFLCERDALKAALASAAARAKAGADIPVLSHILIEAGASEITITGNDLTCCSQINIPAEVSEPGAVVVPGANMSRLVAGLSAATQVKVEQIDAQVKITCGRSTYRFPTLPVEDFPDLMEVENATRLTLSAAQVHQLFGVPAPAISSEQTRFYLCGIYLHRHEKKLRAVATTGHILILNQVEVTVDPSFTGAIVPDASCDEIVKIVGKDDAAIEISDTLISVQAGNRRFVSKLVAGTFPDYGRVIPQINTGELTIDAKEADAALGRLAAACDAKATPTVKLEWDAVADKILASVKTSVGNGQEEISCTCEGREPGEIGFQIAYLRQLIAAVGGDSVKLFIGASGDPMRLESVAAKNVLAVCMPCRV